MFFDSVEARESEFDRLAAALEGQHDSLTASLLERVRAKGPALDRAGDVRWEQIGEHTSESLRVQLRSFRAGRLPERCPEVDTTAVEALAKKSELELLLYAYRSAQKTLWEAWFELIEDSSALLAPQRRELLARGSDYFFRYADRLSDYIAEASLRELDNERGNGEQRRFRAVRELLAGDPEAAAGLDFDLDRHHLGVLARGEGAETAIRQLTALLERPALLTGPLTGVRWAWISGTRPFELPDERLFASFQPPPGASLAVGEPAYGETGFCSTHRQAQRAHWASRFTERPLVLYAEVAVESLASENPEEARRFIARELGGIEDDSPDSQRIRETLIAYFDCEHNAASAAARLGVHQQTVANRLRAVEERLGRPVGSRRLELELAMRLRATLSAIDC